MTDEDVPLVHGRTYAMQCEACEGPLVTWHVSATGRRCSHRLECKWRAEQRSARHPPGKSRVHRLPPTDRGVPAS